VKFRHGKESKKATSIRDRLERGELKVVVCGGGQGKARIIITYIKSHKEPGKAPFSLRKKKLKKNKSLA